MGHRLGSNINLSEEDEFPPLSDLPDCTFYKDSDLSVDYADYWLGQDYERTRIWHLLNEYLDL